MKPLSRETLSVMLKRGKRKDPSHIRRLHPSIEYIPTPPKEGA
jgi:hypothetical protein